MTFITKILSETTGMTEEVFLVSVMQCNGLNVAESNGTSLAAIIGTPCSWGTHLDAMISQAPFFLLIQIHQSYN